MRGVQIGRFASESDQERNRGFFMERKNTAMVLAIERYDRNESEAFTATRATARAGGGREIWG